jgi:hypothetical protein
MTGGGVSLNICSYPRMTSGSILKKADVIFPQQLSGSKAIEAGSA